MFQKHKHGNISFLMMICIAIMLTSSIMLLNIGQRYKEQRVLIKSYQEDLTNASIYEVIADGIIEQLDGLELEAGSNIWTQDKLEAIQSKVLLLLDKKVELTGSNPLIEAVESVDITSNNYRIIISNISKTIRTELEAIGTDDSGNTTYDQHVFYTLDLSSCKIKLVKVEGYV